MAEEEKKEVETPVEMPVETPGESLTETPAETTEVAPEEPAGEEAPELEAEVTEPEPPKNKYADRLAKAYPDREFKSDEDYEKSLEEYLGELEGYKERGSMANQKLIALFESEPQVGDVVRDMINGATFREALARHMSPEDLTAIEGDPDFEGWNKNKAAREEDLNKRKAKQDEYSKNLEFSQQAIEEFAKENNMDDDVAGQFLARFDAMLADINNGKVSKDVLMTIKRAWDYDNDIAAAKEQGELAGKNKNIVAQKEKAKPQGDGLPKIGGSSETPETNRPAPTYIDGLLERTNRKRAL
ncbi:MAG TPA: hypothetical protein DDW27_21415 [Bacteroidales bacterium]|nr:hypothetical protein [Bacteroidales bacterium]